MADFKHHMSRHLYSAKQWLTRAEESFDKDSNIRGELDLFLAQAELQRARETNHSRNSRHKYPILRHALSLITATTIVAAGVGAYWWSSGSNIAPAPPAIQEAKNIPAASSGGNIAVSPAKAEVPQPAAATNTVPVQATVPPAVERTDKTERSRPPEKENILAPDEMQKIIRAAGKSLRGQ